MTNNKTFSEVCEQFAEAAAALIEHESCPDRVYRAIADLNGELAADLSPVWTEADEADAIRRNLPSLLQKAARLETLGVKNDEL